MSGIGWHILRMLLILPATRIQFQIEFSKVPIDYRQSRMQIDWRFSIILVILFKITKSNNQSVFR